MTRATWVPGVALFVLAVGAGCGGDGGTNVPVGSITGVVHDSAAAPIAGVTVALRASGSGTNLQTVATDNAGAYTFPALNVANYDVFLPTPPAAQVTTAQTVPVTVTDGGLAVADFTVRLLAVSFATHIQPVFTGNCTGCHFAGFGGGPPMGLILTADSSYVKTVDVAAGELGSMKRIRPSLPDSSYLIHKVQNTQASVGGSGVRMPQGAPALSAYTINLLRRWVAAGAANN